MLCAEDGEIKHGINPLVGEGQLKVHLACLRAPPIVSSPPHCLCRTIARTGSSKNIRMVIKGQTRNG